jgi:hypothetical protein
LVNSPIVTINNDPGDQTDPHVSGDLAAYTDAAGNTTVRYYRFSSGVDAAISMPSWASDRLPDVSGNRIAFTRLGIDRNVIFVFDATTDSLTEVYACLKPTGLCDRRGLLEKSEH